MAKTRKQISVVRLTIKYTLLDSHSNTCGNTHDKIPVIRLRINYLYLD